MCQFLKIFKRLIPLSVFFILSGCGETAASETNIGEINTSEMDTGEAGTDEMDTGKVESYNADPTCLPDVLPDVLPDYTDTPEDFENLSPWELYYKLAEELGTDHVGGTFYIEGSSSLGIWLTQETFDAWEERELTDCELAVKQAEKAGRIYLRIGKYSLEDLYTFQELLKPFFCERGEVGIYDTKLNAQENKIWIYAHKNIDFAKLYELVPEDAVSLQLSPYAMWIWDL